MIKSRALLPFLLISLVGVPSSPGAVKEEKVPDSFKDHAPLRQFTVKGVVIKARNKKTAEKIYRLHHGKKAGK